MKDHVLVFSEYEIGDYERVFTLSEETDWEKNKAMVKHSILRLKLSKAEKVKQKKLQLMQHKNSRAAFHMDSVSKREKRI